MHSWMHQGLETGFTAGGNCLFEILRRIWYWK
jgi:hypothetical protein